jgi:hypothetical protein
VEEAQREPHASAAALTALFRGEDGEDALVGAHLLADGLAALRHLREAFTKR